MLKSIEMNIHQVRKQPEKALMLCIKDSLYYEPAGKAPPDSGGRDPASSSGCGLGVSIIAGGSGGLSSQKTTGN